MIKRKFIYKAYVVSVYDGDTITIDIDLGFNMVFKNQKIRLSNINAPELRAENNKGRISKEWLESKILNKFIVIKTYKHSKDKYGRWLGDIYIDDIFINELMVKEGYAVNF